MQICVLNGVANIFALNVEVKQIATFNSHFHLVVFIIKTVSHSAMYPTVKRVLM